MNNEKLNLDLQLVEITEKNIGSLKILNSAIFPVHYNEKFYSDLLYSTHYSTLGFFFFFSIFFKKIKL